MTQKLKEQAAIDRAIAVCGGVPKLAAAAGVTVQAIYHWRGGVRRITPAYALKIEAATGGVVPRAELCPEIFGV